MPAEAMGYRNREIVIEFKDGTKSRVRLHTPPSFDVDVFVEPTPELISTIQRALGASGNGSPGTKATNVREMRLKRKGKN